MAFPDPGSIGRVSRPRQNWLDQTKFHEIPNPTQGGAGQALSAVRATDTAALEISLRASRSCRGQKRRNHDNNRDRLKDIGESAHGLSPFGQFNTRSTRFIRTTLQGL
jgi:hypothetical protein